MSSSASEFHGEVDSIQKPVTTVNNISSTSDICFMGAQNSRHFESLFQGRVGGVGKPMKKKIRKIGAFR
jgi:hypothetical protein